MTRSIEADALTDGRLQKVPPAMPHQQGRFPLLWPGNRWPNARVQGVNECLAEHVFDRESTPSA
ncbi:hypothetical protein [Stenotrophomonas sp. ZAC14A_NAIMI4_1]|uniref:hypothetical protein n=1 Tax=Stenotrophomonas sp. ZAC14A_NAIMI4_1 TaxID=2072412 RepID=UPI000D53DE82|nr:hypothetical protein C1926_19020 [Stenotrophomonas sp. ZAC14A_NAIMI4_1]